ncbi:MAG TPA: hypothetical protein VFB80_00810 [Pirellulaceae bacterium]|nr:hypothetical protein [Pirellulaceae bacterium]
MESSRSIKALECVDGKTHTVAEGTRGEKHVGHSRVAARRLLFIPASSLGEQSMRKALDGQVIQEAALAAIVGVVGAVVMIALTYSMTQ